MKEIFIAITYGAMGAAVGICLFLNMAHISIKPSNQIPICITNYVQVKLTEDDRHMQFSLGALTAMASVGITSNGYACFPTFHEHALLVYGSNAP